MIDSLDGMEVLIVFVLGYAAGAGGMALLTWIEGELNKRRIRDGKEKNF